MMNEDQQTATVDRTDDSTENHGQGQPQAAPAKEAGSESKPNDSEAGGADKKPDKPSLFKRPLFWVILFAVIATLLIGGFLYWRNARQYESTDDAFVDAHIVRIAPQVAGTLVKVADIDNRHVQAGQLLAIIEPSGPQAQLAEAQANAKQAEAQYHSAVAQIDAARSNEAQAAAQAEAPVANAIKAERDLARYEQLARLDRSAVAGQQLDQARAAARSATAQALAARRQVSANGAQVAVAQRQANAAREVVAARQAQIKQAGVTMGNLRLVAPVAGQVVNRQVNVGSYVAPGSQLMAIVPDRIWITANFKETQLALMRRGQPVQIKVDAFPEVKFAGRIDSIQRGAGQAFALLPPQNATGNYVKVVQRVPVRILFDIGNGPDPRNYPIGPGMSVVPTVKVR